MQSSGRGSDPTRDGDSESQAGAPAERLIAVGQIMGAHGVHGDLRIKLHNADSELLYGLPGVHVRREGQLRWHEIEQVRPGGKGLIVRLSGVETTEQAKALFGGELVARRSALPELPPGEFYHCDLEGLAAVNPAGEPVGTVECVFEYPAADVLRVSSPRGMLEVPMREPYLLAIDLEAGHVLLDQLDDLEPEPPRSGRNR
jgi:16S rRNA processing protein RimM